MAGERGTPLEEAGPCPACAGAGLVRKTNELAFRAGLRLAALRCGHCGHRWLPTSKETQSLIESAYGSHYTGFRIDEHFRQVIARELETRLIGVKPPPAALLDVGCGNGEFLTLARASGYHVRGIDISPTASRLCIDKGLDVVAGDFLNHDLGRGFDIVTMWDVMEHLRSPAEFSARACELLGPAGVLVLKIPGKGPLNFGVLRLLPSRGGTLLGAPNHVQFFSETSLARMLRRSGFAEVLWLEHRRFRRVPPSVNPRKVLARAFARAVARAAGDRNLYVMASKVAFGADVIARVPHRRHERLASAS